MRENQEMRRVLAGLIVVIAGMAIGIYLFAGSILSSDLVRSALERQLAARLGQPVRIGAAAAVVFPRIAVDLKDVAVGEPAAIQLANVRLVIGLAALWSREVSDARVVVTGGRIALPLPFPLAASDPATPPSGESGGITITCVRLLALRDLVLAAGERTLHVDVEASLDGDRLNVSRVAARAERTRLDATGTFSSLAKLEGSFEARAEPLDVEEMIAVVSALTTSADSGPTARARDVPPVPMHLTVKTIAPTGTFAGYAFRDLSTTAEILPGRVTFSPLSVTAFGGSITGRLDVETAKQVPHLLLTARLDGIDVAQLLTASGSAGSLTGRLGGSVSIRGAGATSASLLETARGSVAAAIADGSMPHLDMVRTIVLAFGKPSGAPPPGSGSAFSRLGGTLSLSNTTLTSDDLAMAARDFDMAGRGSLRLDTNAVDATADVVLSPELTARAGTDLRRYAQEDGRVVVPATISGTLQQPKISLDLTAAARRAIGNELKRRATSILDRLFKRKDD